MLSICSRKILNRTTVSSGSCTTVYKCRGNEICALKKHLHSRDYYGISHKSQEMGTPQVSVSRYMEEETVLHIHVGILSARTHTWESSLHTHMGILSSHTKSETMHPCTTTWMEPEDVIVSEISWDRRKCSVNSLRKSIPAVESA